MKLIKIFSVLLIQTLFLFSVVKTSAQVINDPLQGSTNGTQVGGSFTDEGYKPGIGNSHILYTVPSQVANGYIEFEMKGFSPSDFVDTGNDHAFLMMFDGRGVGSVPTWDNFRDNYFRWNFHWRQSISVFKCVVNAAAPTSQRLNSNFAVFSEDMDGDGDFDINDRDWYDEPSGSTFTWDNTKVKWYTIKIEWNNKTFKVYIDGQNIWSNHKAGLYDYNPVDFKIWLGSGVDKYDSDVSGVIYRNFKLYNLGGTSNYLALSPSSRTVFSTAGSTTFTISSNVSWSVSDNASWLNVTPVSGNNNTTLTASYEANSTTSSRTGTITVIGDGMTRTVNVIQEGIASSNYLNVSPSSKNVTSSAGNTTFSIESDLNWTISENISWFSVNPTNSSGNGTLTVSYDENTTTSSRSGTINITAGSITESITLSQSASVANNYINVSPLNHSVTAFAGSVTFNIESNVTWNITDNTDWLVKSPKTGTGNGSFTATFPANSSSDIRVATISIAGSGIETAVSITQSGSNPFLNIIPLTQEIADSSDTTSLIITSNISWEISDDTDWLNYEFNNGSGNSSINLIYSENSSVEKRTATITIAGEEITKTATIVQNGKIPYLNIPQDSIIVGDTLGGFILNVESNFACRVVVDAEWLTISNSDSIGNFQIYADYVENSDSNFRTANIIISGKELNKSIFVKQLGKTYFNIIAESIPNEAGIITGSGLYNMGSTITLTAIPNQNWKFLNWTENDQIVSSDSIYIFNADSSKNLKAIFTQLTNVKIFEEIPLEFSLNQNYPNPFNPSTIIEYSIPQNTNVRLSLFNMIGQKVKDLIDEFHSSGYYKLNLNASDLPSGIYFYKIETTNFTQLKKMILIK